MATTPFPCSLLKQRLKVKFKKKVADLSVSHPELQESETLHQVHHRPPLCRSHIHITLQLLHLSLRKGPVGGQTCLPDAAAWGSASCCQSLHSWQSVALRLLHLPLPHLVLVGADLAQASHA